MWLKSKTKNHTKRPKKLQQIGGRRPKIFFESPAYSCIQNRHLKELPQEMDWHPSGAKTFLEAMLTNTIHTPAWSFKVGTPSYCKKYGTQNKN